MRLPVVSGREVVKALRKAGFVIVRQRSSHIRLEKTTKDKTIKITVPHHKELKRKTLSMIIRFSELTTEEFMKLL